jgi:hypothetical protein
MELSIGAEGRGVVLSGVSKQASGGIEVRGVPERQVLRTFLAYWDKLELPQYAAIQFNEPDIDYLQAEDALTCPVFDFSSTEDSIYCYDTESEVGVLFPRPAFPPGPKIGPFPGPMHLALQYIQSTSMILRDSDEPNRWVLGQGGDDLALLDAESTRRNMLELELSNCLPAPSDEVGLGDILAFKRGRRDELKSLRFALSELAYQALEQEGTLHAEHAAVGRLKNTLWDLERVANESFMSRVKSSLKVEFNFGNIAGAAAIAGSLSQSIGIPFPVGAGAGGLAASISFRPSKLWSINRLSDGLADYAYVLRLHQEIKP